jgi:acetyltransferase-like isoleucine patch superfamily enzyme
MVVTTNDNYMGRTERRFAEMKGCVIRRGARIGGGSHLLPGIEIGEEAFVATGSVVTRDIAPRALVMGVPARVVREVPEEELLDADR